MTKKEFNSTVFPLKDKIFRFAKRLLVREVEAEDVTQDVFLKLWSKKEDIEKYRSVEALVMTMTKNMCLDRIKSPKRKNDILKTDNLAMDLSPEKQLEENDSIAIMNSIINELPPKQKMIIQLRDVEGYEFKEIEEITSLSLNTIRVNLSRARLKVKEELTKQFQYGVTTH